MLKGAFTHTLRCTLLRCTLQRSAACVELVTAVLRCAFLPVAFANNVIDYRALLLAR